MAWFYSIGLTAQNTIYVNINVSGGNNDGTSWANAYGNLQDALTDSNSGDQIWVAAGTYAPGTLETDSFSIPSDVTVLGGFNATETTADERNWATNPTILSGDLNHSGSSDPGDSHTIVTMIGNNAEINGFYVQWGHADDLTDNTQPAIGSSGAGIYNNGNNKIFNCNIRNNKAGVFIDDLTTDGIGAGLVSYGGTLGIVNTLFDSNTASAGGAISLESGNINITNCTIANNHANIGGGVHFYSGSINVTNSIFTDNSGTNGNINDDGPGTGTANYCLFYNTTTDNDGSLPPNIAGSNNIENADPIFTNGYQLNYNSPAIETGNNTAYSNAGGDVSGDLDLAGSPRLHASTIDMGAYENQRLLLAPDTDNILYVDRNVSGGTADGSSWANAVPELSDALLWAKQNESSWTTAEPLQVWVAEGTYKPTATTDRTIGFELFGNLQLIGGFSPGNGSTDLATRDFKTYSTVLSGDIGTLGDNTDNSYSVVCTNGHIPNLTVDGITIEQGYASSFSGAFDDKSCGGGWFHYAAGSGLSSDIILKNTIVQHNTSLHAFGGGIGSYVESNAEVRWTIENCIFRENASPEEFAGYGRGAAYWSASRSGASSETNIVNSLFYDNHAGSRGTLEFFNGAHSINTITNSTIANNTVASNEGKAVSLSSATVSFYNSILWNGGNEIADFGATASVHSSLVEGLDNTPNGGLDGTDASMAPGFADTANNDFTLLDTSPAVDAGNNTAYTNADGDLSNDLDLAGNLRLHASTIDMGAYEFNPALNTTPSLTVSTFTIFPNPVKNNLNIKTIYQLYNYTVYNIQGQKVMEGYNNTSNSINVSKLPSGIYLLKLRSGNNSQNFKIMKE